MSRTYRRKNDLWDFNAFEYDYKNGHIYKRFLDKNSNEYKIKKAKFHSDKRRYGSGVPSDFVNLFCERGLRQKTKSIIKNWFKNEEEDCLVPEFIRDAGWKYW